MSQNQLLKSTFIYFIGNFGAKILSFLLLPLFSVFLTTAEFGVYDLLLGLVNLLVPVMTFQVSDATYRWLLDSERKKSKVAAITNGLVVLTVGILVFTVLLSLLSVFVNIIHFSYLVVFLVVSCYLPFFQQIARGLGKAKLYAFSGLFNTIFFLVLTVLALTMTSLKVEGVLLASMIGSLLCVLILIVRLNFTRYLSKRVISYKLIKQMLVYSAPLVPNTISWWFINIADKYVILYYLGSEANGIYGMAARFPAFLTILNGIFLLAWQDYSIIAKENNESAAKANKIFDMFVKFQFGVVLFLIPICGFLINNFISNNFIESASFVPILFLGATFSALSGYIGASYLKAKKTRGIFFTSLGGAVINISISLFLIPSLGLYAPSVGTLLGFGFVFIFRVIDTRKILNLSIKWTQLGVLFSLALVQIFFIKINTNVYYHVILVFISALLAFILNRELLRNLLVQIRAKIFK